MLLACDSGSVKKTEMVDDSNDTVSVIENNKIVPVDTVPQYAQKIIEAYPDFCIKYEAGNLVFADGTMMLCDDGKEKSFVEKLDNCDIEDMFSMKYDTSVMEPSYLNDCGRGRCEELFKKIPQGRHCKIAEISAIIGMCGRIQISSNNRLRIRIHTENSVVARKYFTLLKKTYNIETVVSVRQSNKQSIYTITTIYHEDAVIVLQGSKLLDK